MPRPDRMLLPHYSMIPASFAERVEAAVAGGFAAIGMTTQVWRRANDEGATDADLRALLEAHGIRLAQVESFGMPGRADQATFDSAVDEVLRMTEAFGCEEFFVVARDGVPLDEHVETFAGLCDRAATVGLRVGVEFMPIPGVSGVADAAAALALVEAADRPNAGIAVDTFHHYRGPARRSDLEAIPASRIAVIQLNDAAASPIGDGYIDETMHHRMPPGEGALPLADFITLMDAKQPSCWWSIEVLSAELAALPPAEVGRRLGDATRALFTARTTFN